ncbi:DNA translocase FtsK [Streptomyces sp. NPDC059459]|uniref:DNA translocase FtsK n=1 Tax=Streptomyces sp. NPDC059459 TaxID=3346839 RepID=UPI0036A0ABA5
MTERQVDEALRLVVSRKLAAASAVQRWMSVSFREAEALLDQLERRGMVGPADGSKARDLYARYCEQCGRIGKRAFHAIGNDDHGIRITECSNRAACRKRWPKPTEDDA